MQQVISFSGGRTSAYLVNLLHKSPDVHVVFMDTGAEHPATYQFIRDIVRHWNVKITCLRATVLPMGKGMGYEVVPLADIGPDFTAWKRMLEKYGHPYVGGAFCTDRMKLKPFTRYCNETFGKGNYETWLGIRCDEPVRLTQKPGVRYLAEVSDMDKADILQWWRGQAFDLQLQEHLGNCVFCIKKSMMKIALAAKDMPHHAAEFWQMVEAHDVKSDKAMYRGKASLPQVIAMFSDISRQDLAGRMLSMKQYESGSCSESCEVFND